MSHNLDKASAKILVLGDSGVGKSSLIHLICHSAILSSPQWTIGCSIDVKMYQNCYLEFWDIGGSRSHKIARSFLYQDYHGIILVFDATNNKSRLNLNEWLTEVTHKNNDKNIETCLNINVPAITIATKKDLLPHGSALDISSESSNYYDYRLVNFTSNNNPMPQRTQWRTNDYPLISSSSSTSYTLSRSSSSSSASLLNVSNKQDNEQLLNQVIYVNTQDVLSFSPGSRNHEMLNNYFAQVIDGRNRFYNKFAI